MHIHVTAHDDYETIEDMEKTAYTALVPRRFRANPTPFPSYTEMAGRPLLFHTFPKLIPWTSLVVIAQTPEDTTPGFHVSRIFKSTTHHFRACGWLNPQFAREIYARTSSTYRASRRKRLCQYPTCCSYSPEVGAHRNISVRSWKHKRTLEWVVQRVIAYFVLRIILEKIGRIHFRSGFPFSLWVYLGQWGNGYSIIYGVIVYYTSHINLLT